MPVGTNLGSPYATAEFWLFTAEDNTQYLLGDANDRAVLSIDGTGMPPVDYITQRGPFQHGESVVDYFLRPRTMAMRVYVNSCSRAQYWSKRSALLDGIRPNKGVNGRLRQIRADGTLREIVCTIMQGPNFNPRNPAVWDERAFQEELRFIAYNPVWYNPTARTATWPNPTTYVGFPYTFTFTFTPVESPLIFPITFPIIFGQFKIPVVVNYAGSWEENPVFTITGPFIRAIIENQTTGETIDLVGNVNSGETVTIDTRYGKKTIVKQDGSNFISALQSNSNLATWHLAPGNNTIVVTMWGWGAASQVVATYYDRYIGI